MIISEPQAMVSELLAQYSVLFTEILDHILLPLIHPTRQHDHNEMKQIKGSHHRQMIVSSQFGSNARPLLIRGFGPYERAAHAKEAGERSLVVLAFVDLNPNTESSFADGLAEEIIKALTRVPGLRVIARASASLFKHRALPVRESASRVNARLVLDGTIRTAGKRSRVTAQLIDGAEEICL